MAKRPAPEQPSALPLQEALRALIDSRGRLAVRVTPNARQATITLPQSEGEVLNVRVTAAPDGGKANSAVVALVAEALGVAKSSLRIARGSSSRHKTLIVSGP